MAPSKSKHSTTSKQSIKKKSERQDVIQSEPKAESGTSGEPVQNPLTSQQISITLDKLAGHVNLLTDAVQNLNYNYIEFANHLVSLTNRTEKVEKYLSGFETTFTTFQKILEQQTASQLQHFEQKMKNQ